MLKLVKQLLEYIHTGDFDGIYKACEDDVMWKHGKNYRRGNRNYDVAHEIMGIIAPSKIKGVIHCDSHTVYMSDNILVTGEYRVEYESYGILCSLQCNYTIVLHKERAIYIQISTGHRSKRLHQVVAVNESIYFLQESKILYVESINNHTIWHSMDYQVETKARLKNIEESLSNDFVRVHRSYIINRKMILSIQRCSVTMVNGDIIPIPYKKYVNVRAKLAYEQ